MQHSVHVRHHARWAVVLLLLWSVVPLFAQSPAHFEGVFETRNVTTNETGGLEEFTMTMWIKPDRVKISTGSAGSPSGTTMIYRRDRRVIWMLTTEDRTYVEMEQEEGPGEREPQPGTGEYRIRKTGKKVKILGYVCEQVVITRRDERTELWGSKKLAHLKETLAAVLGTDRTANPADWTDQVDKLGFFPLRSTTRIAGRMVEEQEVTRIQETALVPEIFDLPSGYVKQDLDRLLEEAPHNN